MSSFSTLVSKDSVPPIPLNPSNSTDNGGFCETIMHFSVRVDDMQFSVFGICNTVFLILSAFYLLSRLSHYYTRSYSHQDAPLQQLLLANESPHSLDQQMFRSPRRNQARDRRIGNMSNMSSSKYQRTRARSFFNSPSSWRSSAVLVAPEYYVFTLFSVLVLILNATAWVIPPGGTLGSVSSTITFMSCIWNDALLLLHLVRRPGASALATGILALVPTIAVAVFVHAGLKGRAGTCDYCSMRIPKPGIEYAWLICGMVSLYIACCSALGWSLTPCYKDGRLRVKSPRLRPMADPLTFRTGARQRDFSNTPHSRLRSGSHQGVGQEHSLLRPRTASAMLAGMMAVIYLLSAIAVFFLHYVGHMDGGFCVLLVSDLTYALCYAPILLRTIIVDSKECREQKVSSILRRTLRISDDSPLKLGNSDDSLGSLETGGLLNNQNRRENYGAPAGAYNYYKSHQPQPKGHDRQKASTQSAAKQNGDYDDLTGAKSPEAKRAEDIIREKNAESMRKIRKRLKEERQAEQEQTQDIMFGLLTDPVLNLMNPDDLHFDLQIGAGGFGDVFLGTWRQLPVAIKRLHGVDLQRAAALSALATEADMLANFRHPNTVLFIGMVLTRQYCALVTEYMQGGSVRELLDKDDGTPRTGKNTPWQTRALVLRDAARGMVYLHSATPEPVIHRDLKSANFLLDHMTNPRVCKVCDFGLSTYQEKFGKSLSRVGTPLFAAPEVLRSDEYSESADVYSFGICCWELATASRPFANLKTVKVLHDVAYEGLRPTMEDADQEATPDWLMFLMEKCWGNIPEERPTFPEILSFIEDEMKKMRDEECAQGAPKQKLSRDEVEADWSRRLGVVPHQPKVKKGAAKKWASSAY